MSYRNPGFVNQMVESPFTGSKASSPFASSPKTNGDSGSSSISVAFREMLTEIEITEADRRHASAQQELLRANLESEINVENTFLTGSYRRHTIRRPLQDIDVFAVLDKFAYGETIGLTVDGSLAALDLIEEALRKLYPRSEIKRHDRCIQISFSNTGIGFDVIPAYQTSRDEFWIPDGPRGWILTNPKQQQALVSEANQDRCESMFVPAVKLMKTFNNAHGKLLNGFHLEAMCYHALRFAPLNHQASAAFLFDALSRAVLVTTPDIWSKGEAADRYLSHQNRIAASAILRNAATKAADAIVAESDGRFDDAHALWYEIFGVDYPEKGSASNNSSTASPLSGLAAVASIRSGRASSATSAGMVASGFDRFSRTSTSHGGDVDALPSFETGIADSISSEHRDRLEREIARALSQFTRLERIDPKAAAVDPKLWPVTAYNVDTIYAVLVGEQHSNLGRLHRILVAIPKSFPALEARIFPLVHHVRQVPGPRGFRPLRPYRHVWRDGAMCTHAARDRWDGRLVTLLVYAADWLVRQDYYQLKGVWIGTEIGKRGELRINGHRVFSCSQTRALS